MKTTTPANPLLAAGIAILLGACGGGGGGGAPSPPANNPPSANAGADQAVAEGAAVQLAGSGSDSDGGTLSYGWSQTSGPSGSFDSTTAADAIFTVPLIPIGTQEDIVLRLTVNDGQGGTATDDLTITAASGDYVVFLANKDTLTVTELYLYETQSDTLRRVNDSLVAGGSVFDYRISPDGASIAYRADQDTDGIAELYVAAADGSGVSKINATMANPNGSVIDFQWSPDGSQIVYLADADIDNVPEVYLADRDGGNHSKINGSVGNPASVRLAQPTWSPDGRYIAQLVFNIADGRRLGINTHDTQAGGFSSVRITSLPATADVSAMEWSPDGSSLAFTADQDTDGMFELYAVSPDGTGERKLNAPLIANESVRSFDWAPDGSRISYRAVQETASTVELYTALPDGSGNSKVNATLVAGGAVFRFDWAPDSSRIAYMADQVTDDVQELFSADADGSNNATINGPLVATGFVTDFLWSPDSTRIAYQALQETAGIAETFVSAADGTGNAKVNGPLVAGGATFFTSFAPELNMWSPDSTLFNYPADQFTDGVIEHFVADFTGASEVMVSRTPIAGGALQSFAQWSVDSSALIYLSRQDDAATSELYLAGADGLSNQSVSGPIVSGGGVSFAFGWSP